MENNHPFDTTRMTEHQEDTPERLFGQDNKRKFSTVNMTPNEYYKMAAAYFGTTPKKLIQQRRDYKTLSESDGTNKIAEKMINGEKYGMASINFNPLRKSKNPSWGQEGAHRMAAAGDVYGWDTKMPVVWIRDIDDETDFDKDILPNLDSEVKRARKNKLANDRYYKMKNDLAKRQELEHAAKQLGKNVEDVTEEDVKKYWEDESDWEDLLEEIDND